MAAGRRVVQRVRDVRRVGVQFQHHAHVLHFPRKVLGHQASAQDQAPLFHDETGVFQNRHRLVPVVPGVVFRHASR